MTKELILMKTIMPYFLLVLWVITIVLEIHEIRNKLKSDEFYIRYLISVTAWFVVCLILSSLIYLVVLNA